MFSKQHYITIAEVLDRERVRQNFEDRDNNGVPKVAVALAAYFAGDNSRFDKKRFFKAIGLEVK